MPKQQSGFTLAELSIVIVVLSILSVFFMPKFERLIVEARIAKVQRLAGVVEEAAAITHTAQIAGQLAETTGVDMNSDGSADVTMDNRFPTADAAGISASILQFATTNLFGTGVGQFTATANAGAGTMTYTLNNVETPASCSVVYTAPATVGAQPTVGITATGCL